MYILFESIFESCKKSCNRDYLDLGVISCPIHCLVELQRIWLTGHRRSSVCFGLENCVEFVFVCFGIFEPDFRS